MPVPWCQVTCIICSSFIAAFDLNKEVSCEGPLMGGGGILEHLYLNVYAEFDSKI